MIPFGLNKEQFTSRYLRCLDRSSKPLIDTLKQLHVKEIPETVEEAEVQIFLGQDGMDAPSVWIYYQGKNTKIDKVDPSIFPGKSLEIINVNEIDDFDEEYYTNEDFSGVNIIADIVKQWFAESWWKAGGWSYSIPTSVWVHDDFGSGGCIKLSEHR